MLNKIDLFNGSVSIHYQNIQQPATEMFETLKGVITEFLKGIFILKTNCLTTKYKSLNSISLFNIQFLMLLKGIFFLTKNMGSLSMESLG